MLLWSHFQAKYFWPLVAQTLFHSLLRRFGTVRVDFIPDLEMRRFVNVIVLLCSNIACLMIYHERVSLVTPSSFPALCRSEVF